MKIFITRPIPEAGIESLKDALDDAQIEVGREDRVMSRETLLEGVKGADAIMSMLSDRMDGEAMDAAGPQLKVVANFAVGYDNIDVAEARRRGIHATNTPGVLTEATADLAWTLIMCAARRAGEGERLLRAGAWEGWGPQQLLGVSVFGQILGIFGMGRIGQAVARRARGFNMTVLYHDANRLDSETETQLSATFVDKDTLLAQSDIVSIHCPLTEQTRHAFTLAEFRRMKPTAVLVNTSRGPVVKEEDLILALKEGVIFGAGLDVYEREPEVHKALLREERAVLLPHLGSATMETRNAMARTAAANIVAALRGERPRDCVSCCA
ncbi:MAG TPA: D-glycerate dehydrogenase [Candidatus Hydrogenedentes bacterium]|nr:D-glycerate dehydrogenase [Candidatus Hydrogenedentota bacterium]